MGNAGLKRKRPVQVPRPDSISGGDPNRPAVDSNGAVQVRGHAQMKAFAAMGQMGVTVV